MTPDYFQTFARYNRWMNDKVYAAASRLTDEERKQDRQAFFKSIHATLNHLLVADNESARVLRRQIYLSQAATAWLC